MPRMVLSEIPKHQHEAYTSRRRARAGHKHERFVTVNYFYVGEPKKKRHCVVKEGLNWQKIEVTYNELFDHLVKACGDSTISLHYSVNNQYVSITTTGQLLTFLEHVKLDVNTVLYLENKDYVWNVKGNANSGNKVRKSSRSCRHGDMSSSEDEYCESEEEDEDEEEEGEVDEEVYGEDPIDPNTNDELVETCDGECEDREMEAMVENFDELEFSGNESEGSYQSNENLVPLGRDCKEESGFCSPSSEKHSPPCCLFNRPKTDEPNSGSSSLKKGAGDANTVETKKSACDSETVRSRRELQEKLTCLVYKLTNSYELQKAEGRSEKDAAVDLFFSELYGMSRALAEWTVAKGSNECSPFNDKVYDMQVKVLDKLTDGQECHHRSPNDLIRKMMHVLKVNLTHKSPRDPNGEMCATLLLMALRQGMSYSDFRFSLSDLYQLERSYFSMEPNSNDKEELLTQWMKRKTDQLERACTFIAEDWKVDGEDCTCIAHISAHIKDIRDMVNCKSDEKSKKCKMVEKVSSQWISDVVKATHCFRDCEDFCSKHLFWKNFITSEQFSKVEECCVVSAEQKSDSSSPKNNENTSASPPTPKKNMAPEVKAEDPVMEKKASPVKKTTVAQSTQTVKKSLMTPEMRKELNEMIRKQHHFVYPQIPKPGVIMIPAGGLAKCRCSKECKMELNEPAYIYMERFNEPRIHVWEKTKQKRVKKT